MVRYMLILAFVVGMMCSASVVFAGLLGPGPDDCYVTIKCVCESKFGGATRVVRCPTPTGGPFFVSQGPEGTVGVNCGLPLFDSVQAAFCEDLDIRCNRWEKPNCLLTLPIQIPQPTPPPG